MKTKTLGTNTPLEVPVIALGCMRINGLELKQAEHYLQRCLELGINFFDHADIYGGGKCETFFAQAMHLSPSEREKVILQSKCAIHPGKMYDFSKEHILKSVDEILKRLGTEYLDILLLHRPDALMEPEEVAEAFDELEKSGKVRHFGVSNHKPSQIELLKTCVKQDLIADQLQFSLPFSGMIASGMEVNMLSPGSFDHDGSVLDYCRINNITVQAWSPFGTDNWGGVFLVQERYAELNKTLKGIGERYGVSATTIATAWILRHPAKIQVIAGTTNEKRMEEIAKAAEITLTREEWYQLYLAAGHILP